MVYKTTPLGIDRVERQLLSGSSYLQLWLQRVQLELLAGTILQVDAADRLQHGLNGVCTVAVVLVITWCLHLYLRPVAGLHWMHGGEVCICVYVQ